MALCLRLEYILAFLLCNFLLFLTLYLRCLNHVQWEVSKHFLGALQPRANSATHAEPKQTPSPSHSNS